MGLLGLIWSAEVAAALAGLGAEMIELRLPDPSQIVRDWSRLCALEVAAAHLATWQARRDNYGPALSGLIAQGHQVTAFCWSNLSPAIC